MSIRNNGCSGGCADVAPSVIGSALSRVLDAVIAKRIQKGVAYPGRQYSTANLNTPCRSGALN